MCRSRYLLIVRVRSYFLDVLVAFISSSVLILSSPAALVSESAKVDCVDDSPLPSNRYYRGGKPSVGLGLRLDIGEFYLGAATAMTAPSSVLLRQRTYGWRCGAPPVTFEFDDAKPGNKLKYPRVCKICLSCSQMKIRDALKQCVPFSLQRRSYELCCGWPSPACLDHRTGGGSSALP